MDERIPRDEAREHRIDMEAIVDCYGPEEQAMGWYTYLDDRLRFPFQARCLAQRRLSPLRPGDIVQVAGMADEEDCLAEMFVVIAWQGRELGVPLSQLEPLGADAATAEAAADWRYWVERGHQLQ